MEDRYSVMVRVTDQIAADGLYCSFNGKKFSPSEVVIVDLIFFVIVLVARMIGLLNRLLTYMFLDFQAEVCHILFLISAEFTDSAEIAGTPPDGCTELPTCPVCLGETQKIVLVFPFLWVID